jgi:hypothetical protein
MGLATVKLTLVSGAGQSSSQILIANVFESWYSALPDRSDAWVIGVIEGVHPVSQACDLYVMLIAKRLEQTTSTFN